MTKSFFETSLHSTEISRSWFINRVVAVIPTTSGFSFMIRSFDYPPVVRYVAHVENVYTVASFHASAAMVARPRVGIVGFVMPLLSFRRYQNRTD